MEEEDQEQQEEAGGEPSKDVSPEDSCEIWPEHLQAYQLFQVARSQFEISLGGMGGMHHGAVRSVNLAQEMAWMDIPPKEQAPLLVLYRQIEAEALNVLNERAQEQVREAADRAG